MTWNGTTLAVTGTLTATAGTIGGFSIGATTITGSNLVLDSAGQRISLGTSNDIVILDADDATYRLWIGNATASSATFSVTKAGAVSATSGTVGGFTLGATTLTATNLILDASGQRITLGSSNDVVILDADDADYRLWIGNSTAASAPFRIKKTGAFVAGDKTNEKYLEFDGTDVFIGRDTELNGADSYNNDAIYWHTFWDTLDNFSVSASGTGSAGFGSGGLNPSLGGGATDAASVQRTLPASGTLTWAKDRRIKTSIKVTSTDMNHGNFVYGMGTPTLGGVNEHVGVYLDETMALRASVANGTTQSTAAMDTLVTATTYLIEMIFDSGTSAKFYIDNILKATITTNLPSGTTSANIPFRMALNTDGTAVVGGLSVLFSEFKFLQEA